MLYIYTTGIKLWNLDSEFYEVPLTLFLEYVWKKIKNKRYFVWNIHTYSEYRATLTCTESPLYIIKINDICMIRFYMIAIENLLVLTFAADIKNFQSRFGWIWFPRFPKKPPIIRLFLGHLSWPFLQKTLQTEPFWHFPDKLEGQTVIDAC